MLKIKLIHNFQKMVAEQLTIDELGEIKDNYLYIQDKDVYLLSVAELGQLDAPDFFTGSLTVTLVGRNSCRLEFHDHFGRHIPTYSINGCVLTYEDSDYILPKDIYTVLCKVESFIQTQNKSIMFEIIELIRSYNTNHIKLNGWNNKEKIISVPKIKIDIQLDENGNSTITPFLEGVSDAEQTEHIQSILEAKDSESIIEFWNNENGRTRIRHVIHSSELEAYKRIFNIGSLNSEDTKKFLQNPSAFILQGDESVDDIAIDFDSCRICGMGEPYTGYFGSKSLDSPISKALESSSPHTEERRKITIEKVKSFCNGKTFDELEQAQEKLWESIKNNDDECILGFNTIIENSNYRDAIQEFEKLLKKFQEGERLDIAGKKIVLSIDPNDITCVKTVTDHLKKLEQIRIDNTNPAQLFEDFKPEFTPKSYQIQGVNWLVDLYQNQFRGGILADDMGLGKTFQLITFINYLLNHELHFKGKRILIVAPKSLLDNWKNEFKKFLNPEITNNVHIRILRGQELATLKNVHMNKNGERYNSFDVKQFLNKPLDILLLSYETLSNYQFSFVDTQFNWGCIIYDEAHKIKNPNAQISQAARAISSLCPFNVLLTGTPIENELRDLWALFDVFAPEHFGSWAKFRKEYVSNQADNSTIEHRLRNHASKYLLRRLKKDYLKELPHKQDIEHKITLTESESKEYIHLKNNAEFALTKLHELKRFSLVGSTDGKDNTQQFSKLSKLLELLDEIRNNQEKALIFVIRKDVQNILKAQIENHYGIKVNIINGDTTNTQLLVDQFQSISGFAVIILSTLAAGVGLTITAANHVFHYERWWNASKEDQASDRAYRIGQTKDVFIHYLLAHIPHENTTLDLAIHELIKKKRETAGFLIPPKNITTDEVLVKAGISSLEHLLKELNWREFEQLIKELYQAQGYTSNLTSIGKEDFATDVVAEKENEIIAIQCKHSSKNITQDDSAILGLMQQAKTAWHANKLIAITNTEFSQKAKLLASEYNIEIIDGEGLSELIRKYKDKIPMLQT